VLGKTVVVVVAALAQHAEQDLSERRFAFDAERYRTLFEAGVCRAQRQEQRKDNQQQGSKRERPPTRVRREVSRSRQQQQQARRAQIELWSLEHPKYAQREACS